MDPTEFYQQRAKERSANAGTPPTIPTWEELLRPSLESAQAAQRASRDAGPRVRWTTLPIPERIRREKWEAINGVPWPDNSGGQ